MNNFSYVDIYFMGMGIAAVLVMIIEGLFKQSFEEELIKDVPDAQRTAKGNYLHTIDYLVVIALSWISVCGLLYDIIRYAIQSKTKKK